MRREQVVSTIGASFIVIALATIGLSSGKVDRTKQAKIARAMQAAPKSISKKATIIDTDGKILRKGSNGWVCRPSSGPGSTHPECDDEVFMHFMHALDKKADFKTDRMGFSYMLAGDDNVNNADPFDMKPDPGEVWVQEGPHLMIIVPDPKALEGMSEDPKNGGPYVMWKGTPYAHIMVPLVPKKMKK